MAHYKEMVYHRGKKVSIDSLTAAIAQQRKIREGGGSPCICVSRILIGPSLGLNQVSRHSVDQFLALQRR